MLIYSNSSKSENSCKLFNLKELLIQPMDCEVGFWPKGNPSSRQNPNSGPNENLLSACPNFFYCPTHIEMYVNLVLHIVKLFLHQKWRRENRQSIN